MLNKVIKLFRKDAYQTLNLIQIDKAALINNYRYFQKAKPHAEICPVLKSNAYGHGLQLVGKFVDQKIRPPFLIVDSLYEAYELEKTGVKTPILIIGYTLPENFRVFKRLKKFVFPVYDRETATALNRHQPGARVHLKIDSGMNRLGIPLEQAPEFAEFLKKQNRLHVEGIYSHLAQASNPDNYEYTQMQARKFKEAITVFEKAGFNFKWKHLSATGGSLEIDDPEFNLVRIGAGFYGFSPYRQGTNLEKKLADNLRLALRYQTHLVQIKEIDPGAQVSYGGTFTAPERMTIGILPLGYYDGLDRRLSNRGVVTVGNKYCPIIGKVCMNLTVIDLRGVKNPRVGQEITVFENNSKAPNSLPRIARDIKSVPYNLYVNLSETTRRVMI